MSLAIEPFRLTSSVRTARGEVGPRQACRVRVEGERGLRGSGEAAPLPPWTEPWEACMAGLEAAAPFVRDPVGDPEEILASLDARCASLRRAPAARHALALALLDLAAQRGHEPLCSYLARTRLARTAAPEPLAANALIGAMKSNEAGVEAERASEAGFRVFKLKLAGSLEEDLARAKAVRAAVGPEGELRLDASGAWSLAEAGSRMRALREVHPAYTEQPVPAAELGALRALRVQGFAVAADESAATVEGALRVLSLEAAGVIILKPHALGGPDRALEVVRAAESRGVAVVVTSLLDGPVGQAGAAHVGLCLRAPRPACGLSGIAEGGAFPLERGMLKVPKGIGLGLRGST